MTLTYLWAKFFQKIIRGKAIINSRIDKTVVVNSGCCISETSIAKYSYCGYDCVINNAQIGKFCSIADHVYIGGAEHPYLWVSTSPVFQNVKHSGPKKRFCYKNVNIGNRTVIGHDVWLGHGCSIKQGVRIGNGAVIATGAVVTKDVEDYSIVGGCPAKHIKYRFDMDTIEELNKTQWWNLPDEKLSCVAQYVDNPRLFIQKIKEIQ